jgi:hypothetical protein
MSLEIYFNSQMSKATQKNSMMSYWRAIYPFNVHDTSGSLSVQLNTGV